MAGGARLGRGWFIGLAAFVFFTVFAAVFSIHLLIQPKR
jgi:hypothetical protein